MKFIVPVHVLRSSSQNQEGATMLIKLVQPVVELAAKPRPRRVSHYHGGGGSLYGTILLIMFVVVIVLAVVVIVRRRRSGK